MKDKKNIIITILVIIIIALGTLVGLLATDTISFSKTVDNNKNTETGNKDEENKEKEEEPTTELLTKYDAIDILKTNYNEAIRQMLNSPITYCGERDVNGSTNIDGILYYKSAEFKTFVELDDYVKRYATDKFLTKAGHNADKSYIEQDGALYCSTWNKGGVTVYSPDESKFEVSNITENSFDGKIVSVETADQYRQDTTFEFKVIKQKDKWLFDDYTKVG